MCIYCNLSFRNRSSKCVNFHKKSLVVYIFSKVLYQSAEGASSPSEGASSPFIISINGSGVSAVNITGLRKFVIYAIEMLAFTSVGDGVVSEPPVCVKTFEDGTSVYCIELFNYAIVRQVPSSLVYIITSLIFT